MITRDLQFKIVDSPFLNRYISPFDLDSSTPPTDEFPIPNSTYEITRAMLDNPLIFNDLFTALMDIRGHSQEGRHGEFMACSNYCNNSAYSIEDIYGEEGNRDIRDIREDSSAFPLYSECKDCNAPLIPCYDRNSFYKYATEILDKENSYLFVYCQNHNINGYIMGSFEKLPDLWEEELEIILSRAGTDFVNMEIKKGEFISKLVQRFPTYESLLYINEIESQNLEGNESEVLKSLFTEFVTSAYNRYKLIEPFQKENSVLITHADRNSNLYSFLNNFSGVEDLYSINNSNTLTLENSDLTILGLPLESFCNQIYSSNYLNKPDIKEGLAQHIYVLGMNGKSIDSVGLGILSQIRESYRKWGVKGDFIDDLDCNPKSKIYLASTAPFEGNDSPDFMITIRMVYSDPLSTNINSHSTEALDIMINKDTGESIISNFSDKITYFAEFQRFAARRSNNVQQTQLMLMKMLQVASIDAEKLGVDFLIAILKPELLYLIKKAGVKIELMSEFLGLDNKSIGLNRQNTRTRELIKNYFSYFLDLPSLINLLQDKGIDNVTKKNVLNFSNEIEKYFDEILLKVPDGPSLYIANVEEFRMSVDAVCKKLLI